MDETEQKLKEMQKEVKNLKLQTELQNQINELKAIQHNQVQASQPSIPTPISRLISYILPAGVGILIIGALLVFVFQQFVLGMGLDVFAALILGIYFSLPRKQLPSFMKGMVQQPAKQEVQKEVKA